MGWYEELDLGSRGFGGWEQHQLEQHIARFRCSAVSQTYSWWGLAAPPPGLRLSTNPVSMDMIRLFADDVVVIGLRQKNQWTVHCEWVLARSEGVQVSGGLAREWKEKGAGDCLDYQSRGGGFVLTFCWSILLPSLTYSIVMKDGSWLKERDHGYKRFKWFSSGGGLTVSYVWMNKNTSIMSWKCLTNQLIWASPSFKGIKKANTLCCYEKANIPIEKRT